MVSHLLVGKEKSVFAMRRAMAWGLVWTLAVLPGTCGNPHPVATPSTGASEGTTRVACTAGSTGACRIKLLVFSKTGAMRLSQTPCEVLNADQQAAFERYIHHGGGYAGVHSASDTEYDWPWYGQLVGAYFDRVHGHSQVVQATVHVTDRTHPSTVMLPALWVRTDEWYNFASNPRDHVHVLMTVDEQTYRGGVMGDDHPIAWYHEYDGGRAWYTAMGHTSESYREPLFLAHLWGGILYAAGANAPVSRPLLRLRFVFCCSMVSRWGIDCFWQH